MTNPNQPSKPKRRYTVTDRVLAACRINVEKARKAALERRFCATRGTDAEHQAAHANLEAAQRVRRDDNTYKYCSVFRHGLLVANLERSLVMAGESREEYHAHLARFAALPAALALDAGSDQVKLASACAFASWRRLRAFRLHSEWALRLMVHHLRAVIRQRHTAPGEGEASLAGFGNTFGNIVISSAAAPSGAARNLALKRETMRDSSLPPAPRNDRLDKSFCAPVGQTASLTPEQFLELGRGLRWAAESWPGVWQPITRLNNRFDQLWCMLVHELGEPVPGPNEYFLERARMRMSPLVGRFDLYSADVLGNPLLRWRRIEELLESRPVKVKPAEDWLCATEPYEVQERWEVEFRHRRAEAERLARPVSLMGGLDYRLLREARKRHAESDPEVAPGQGAELPQNFEEFVALVAAAFGGGVQPSMDPRLRGGDEPGTWDPLSNRVIPAKAGIHECSEEAESRNPAPNPAPTLRQLALHLWDSATLPRRRAEKEACLLAGYLTEYAAMLASRDPKEGRKRRCVADSILTLFRQGVKQQEESVVATRRARLALHDIAVERYGWRPEWEPQLLCLNDRFNQHQGEFFDLYFAEVSPQAAAGDG